MDVKNRRVEQGMATGAHLVGTARELFAARGYADVATEEIVRAAGVTRGALYHHFRGKEDLFRAVFEEVERDLTERIAQVAFAEQDPWKLIRAGAAAFLDACLEPEAQRIALMDAPSVLGWEEWRERGAPPRARPRPAA